MMECSVHTVISVHSTTEALLSVASTLGQAAQKHDQSGYQIRYDRQPINISHV